MLKNNKVKILGFGSLLGSGSAMADNTAAITDAIATGSSLVTLTTGGILSVAAICFGVGLVASMLIKR